MVEDSIPLVENGILDPGGIERRSGAGSSAQGKNLTVIMKLGEGSEFVMSFSIN